MVMISGGVSALLATALYSIVARAQDDLGLSNGYITLKTANFEAQLVKDAQVLASLKPSGDDFDFLPFDYLSRRTRNGQYHWGDITFRYRQADSSSVWIDGDSATSRKAVAASTISDGVLASSVLAPTLPSSPLNITREWIDVSGDLGLRFNIANYGSSVIEIGSLGFPAEFNSIFTDRYATDMQKLCSLSDPYIGMHAGHIRVAPTRGTGAALVVTPLGDTPMEAYRNLYEEYYSDTAYGSQTFEGFYEWQVLSKAWAEKEWAGKTPWNTASSRTLQPGESVQFGLRFSVSKNGVRDFDKVIKDTGTPIAQAVPGYIIPQGEPADLLLQHSSSVKSISSSPDGVLQVFRLSEGRYSITPSSNIWGRVPLTITYNDGKIQTVHYYITKPSTQVISDLGNFLTTKQYYTDATDPFGRAPSVISYDYEASAQVLQDGRVWIAGLSDEGGAGSFVAAFMKQSIQPSAEEVTKLEAFIDKVIWGTLQNPDFSVKKSVFYYEKDAPPGDYQYRADIDWTSWTSWNKAAAYSTDRAYDYVHVAAGYWAMYRVARAYPDLTKSHDWKWYLGQAYGTVMRAMEEDVGYNRVGLMGETVFGEILVDLGREELGDEHDKMEDAMRSRAVQWDGEEVPYGSEMAWDSTGQEGVYYWTKYFNFAATAEKTVDSVLGFMPTVPHWGWNGNARRYWDNVYGGKLQRIERQIHHYGSGLNAQVLLSAFRDDPTDTYLARVGYGGISGPMSNINREGFASASFHSWPDTLKWDGYSGDYGPGFLGMALNTGTYIVDDPDFGLVAYGGVVSGRDGAISVRTTDPTRRKVFIGPLGVLIYVDAGVISQVSYRSGDETGKISVTMAQLPGVALAAAANLWVETSGSSVGKKYKVTSLEAAAAEGRGGWSIKLVGTGDVVVDVFPA